MFRKKSIFETWGRSVFDSFIKFYSDRDSDREERHLSPSTTYIHFVNEELLVYIRQESNTVEFRNQQEELLHTEKLPAVEGGREIYPGICLQADAEKLTLKLPVCRWTDHYPNCDGENDRWTWQSIGYHVLSFDRNTHNVQLQLFDYAQ